jgi:membrane-bound metal-dependent hydrolase YbcI (DUF457 family)
MWRSHMVIGASTWLAAQTLAGPLIGSELNSREQACGAVVAAGGALLCDLDTPDSRLAHSLGAVTQLVARVIGRLFGGHRVGTHSLVFCALIAALSTVALAQDELVRLPAGVTLSAGQLVALLIAYVSTALTVALLFAVRGARAALITAALVAVAASTQPPPALISAALTIGCASHLLADLPTPEGIAPLWPLFKRRISLGLIKRTGDHRETLLVATVALGTLATWTGYP